MTIINRDWLILLTLFTAASATPVFNKVNYFDANGQRCPITPALNVTCPVLCVTDISLCPVSVRPVCADSQVPCVDGTCRANCPTDLVNPCSCSGSGSLKLSDSIRSMVPCLAQPNVDIYQYNPTSPKSVESACGSALNLANVSVWAENPKSNRLWLLCPKASASLDLTSPIFVAIWAILGAQIILVIIWSIFKLASESKIKSYYSTSKKIDLDHDRIYNGSINANSSSSSVAKNHIGDGNSNITSHLLPQSSEKALIASASEKLQASNTIFYTTNSNSDVTMIEYSSNIFGKIVYYSLYVSTFSWFVIIVIICLDYYVLLTDTGASLANGNFTLLSKFFIVLWSFVTALLLFFSIAKHKITNFFKLRTKLGSGDVVEVSQYEEIVYFQKYRSSSLVENIQRMESAAKKALGLDKKYNNYPIQTSSQNRKFFEFHSTRYIYQDSLQTYDSVQFDIGKTGKEIFALKSGLSQKEAEYRSEILGQNFIRVNVPSILKSIANEFSTFFYIYQLMILLLFYYYSYYQIGISDTIVILLSALIKVLINVKSQRRLKKLTEYSGSCKVLRDGQFKEENTKSLVVGDVVAIELGQAITFDGVVISGELVVDESSLTGEAMPIRKIPLNIQVSHYDSQTTGKTNSVFAGTRVLQSIPDTTNFDFDKSNDSNTSGDTAKQNNRHTIAIVSKIGTLTEKGKIIRKILYPTQFMFIFNKQIKVVMFILFIQGMFWLGLAAWFLKASSIAAFFSGMFSLSQLISPLLPASLVIGQSVAVQRLRKKNIYCIEMPRVMIAGKVEIFCFDKTGTLTKDGLEFSGVVECSDSFNLARSVDKAGISYKHAIPSADVAGNPQLTFDRINSDVSSVSRNAFVGIGCCHSVTKLGDQMIGNPVDVEMFKNSKWEIDTPKTGYIQSFTSDQYSGQGNNEKCDSLKVSVIKRNEFVHSRASMSVIVHDVIDDNKHVFVKGSFEKIYSICDKNTVPENYLQHAKLLSSQGCYVLGLAQKSFKDVSTSAIINMDLDEIESNLNFVCLLVFNNNLKPDTPMALAQIKESNTRNVMITGDATLTGVFIARKAGMIPENSIVAIGDLNIAGNVEFRNIDTGDKMDSFNEYTGPSNPKGSRNLELAVTGAAFEKMVSDGSLRSYLKHIRVFGRMTPKNKVTCVTYQMELGVTAMCGDGGNDSGALKAAHVGIALSGAEASIVSPFSTSTKSLMSCVELLSQSRGALATSFANYKHLILYGQTMAMFKVMTMYFSISVSQPLWIIIDAFITVGISLAVSLSKPLSKLSLKRPTGRILGPQTLASSVGQVAINWIFMIVAFSWLFKQTWFRCFEFDSSQSNLAQWWLLGDNYEGEVAGFIVVYQFVNVGFIYNFGYLFRERWYKNYVLVSLWALFIIITSYVQLANPNRIGCALRMNCGDPDVLVSLGYKRPTFYIEKYNIPIGHNVLARKDRFILWSMSIANMAIGILWELIVVIGPLGRYISSNFTNKKASITL